MNTIEPTQEATAQAPTPDTTQGIDQELEQLLAEELTINDAVGILVDAIVRERGVEARDLAEIHVTSDGVVRILTRGRVRRSVRVDPFVPAENLGGDE